jgi:hypothetical protein
MTGRLYPYLSYGFRMKTTLNIDDTVMAELKREAARQGRTCPNWSILRCAYCSALNESRGQNPRSATFRSGGTLVEIADRDALYQATEVANCSRATRMW